MHLVKSWSSTQAVISHSSGEAEFYGVVKASGIGLGYQAFLGDLGWTASSAYGPIPPRPSAYAGAVDWASCATLTPARCGSSSVPKIPQWNRGK